MTMAYVALKIINNKKDMEESSHCFFQNKLWQIQESAIKPNNITKLSHTNKC
jgi:hypothetical protein